MKRRESHAGEDAPSAAPGGGTGFPRHPRDLDDRPGIVSEK